MAFFDLESPENNDTDNLVWLGHLSPDSDTIGSAIGAAELFGGEARRAGELNKETAFVVEYCGVEVPKLISKVEGQKVGLVDFNQKTQLHKDVDNSDIVAIIDHHAIQDQPITFNTPVSVDIRPWGSAATILADRFEKTGKEMSPTTACVLLAGILSDTLVFESPTTCPVDKPYAEKLAKIAGIEDLYDFGQKMMEAKSDLADVSTYDVLKGDFKHYEIKGKKVGFGVAETLLPEQLLERKADLLAEMEGEKAKQGLDFIFFAIVDTKTKNAHLVIYSDAEAELATAAYGYTSEANLMYLPGMMSRKSQLMPAVQATLTA
ncbi:putative manganese-dependent inorganic pyrophosphatase [Marinomonas sp. MED121]|uniref:manganese-dependent inorganic pyrophosphatase n=1 Tax=Marinomonas sp. MED121 TaxID=314277 RepID=UPI0000690FB5|nr:manganese-dependent inorganic pyrophosphatase [Marinomonas sp. MED121]EAQ67126.1 putative manganese-dependent inorganic pyrophosphatase [Marinomonas sp. MED121]